MKRGFTLIELLVVISIISMLSSIVLASLGSARMSGRDAARMQQIHQIDLAIQLYMSTYGHAPDLQNTCNSSYSVTDINTCVARSSAVPSSLQGAAWDKLKLDLAQYIPKIPNDPCPSCTSGSSYPLGYTYVAPRAVKYQCVNEGNGANCPQYSDGQLNQMYQLYAPLEKQSTQSGVSSLGSFFVPPGSSY